MYNFPFRPLPVPPLDMRWLTGKKNLTAMQEMQETRVQSLGGKDPLEEGMATHSSTLAWRILWTEEPGGLQSIGSQSWTQLKQLSTHTTGN